MPKRRQSPEGAFTDAQYQTIDKAIDKLRDRAVDYKQPDLTTVDILHLFVKEEHHRLSIDATALLGTDPTVLVEHRFIDPSLGDPAAKVNVNFTLTYPTGKGITFPKYAGHAIYSNGPARNKVESWLAWRMERGREWSMVNAVFRSLHKFLDTPQQAYFYWPCLTTLLNTSDDTKVRKDAAKLHKGRVPSDLGNIPRSLKRACVDTNNTVAKALLLPTDREAVKLPVKLWIDRNYHCEPIRWGDNHVIRPIPM